MHQKQRADIHVKFTTLTTINWLNFYNDLNATNLAVSQHSDVSLYLS